MLTETTDGYKIKYIWEDKILLQSKAVPSVLLYTYQKIQLKYNINFCWLKKKTSFYSYVTKNIY